MPELLILNPAKRRRSTKKRASAKRTKRRTVRRNPVSAVSAVKRAARRHVSRRARRNPIAARRSRRIRRNPLGMGSLRTSSIVNIIKEAAIGGAGGVGVDYLWNKVLPYLPASLSTNEYASEAVRAAITVAAGRLLKKPTRGLSEKMAVGALIVQAYNLISNMAGGGFTAVNGMGYANPARVSQRSARIGPMQMPGARSNVRQIGRFAPNMTAVLSGVRTRGVTPLLSGSRTALMRQRAASYGNA